MEFLEFKEQYQSLSKRYLEISNYLNIDKIKKEINKLKETTIDENFWNNKTEAAVILKKISKLEYDLNFYKKIYSKYEDLLLSSELSQINEKIDLETINIIKDFSVYMDDLEIKETLNEKDDYRDAIVQIHPGAGGVDSQDWASMLLRMYSKWSDSKLFSVKTLEYQPGDESGLKDVVIEIKGQYAYGLLKSEMGVHRLIRISPFDSNSRRHTSFASIFVYPIIDNDIEISINESEIRVDTYRASGAGGQHVNKTDSAVRITHIESGIAVQCQNQRSQLKNKNTALKLLKSKLYKKRLDEIDKDLSKTNENKKDISWGSQIRSYIFHPYNLIKDHRTKHETSNVSSVMDGNINSFIKHYLLKKIGD
jgi:peptide chain release factor 2|tara:strand:+ start:1586 stop:2683 length:1098 start_codon:yes stop_codon:yes gene_type:complete